MAGKLGEKRRIHYFPVFILLFLALFMQFYAIFMISNEDGEEVTQTDFNDDWDQDDVWTSILDVSCHFAGLLALTMVVLAIKQRRLFSYGLKLFFA